MHFQPLKHALFRQWSFQIFIFFQESLEMLVSQSPETVTPCASLPFVHFERSERSIQFLSTPVLLFTLMELRFHSEATKHL